MKKFIFFFVELDGRIRQIVNGVVTSINTPKQLSHAPDGNQEISIGWERSQTSHGNVRMFGLPFGYVMEAATILRNDFYKFNLDRVLFLLIKRLTYEFTANTFKEYYKQIYKGQLDWATAEDDQGNHRFNIGLLEAGLQKLMKANESTEYEIPLDIDSKNVQMDGMLIEGNFRFFIAPFDQISGGYPGMYQLPNDNPVPGIAFFDIQQFMDATSPDADTLEYFAETTQDINDIVITGKIVNLNDLGAAGPLSVLLHIYNTRTSTLRQTIDLTPADPYPQNYTLIINETLDLLEGDRLFLQSNSHFSGESDLQIYAKSKPLPSTIKGFTLFDLGMKLIEKITGDASNFESSFLQTKNIILTSGDGVRSIPNASIKTNWRDYWKAVDVYCKAQYTITDKVRIGPRIDAYNSNKTTVPLGIVKNFKCTPAHDYIWTSIKVGHAEPQTDDTNGRFDFNSYIVFETGVKAVPDKQLDLQSPWKASPWEIEQMRANYEGKVTTDKETDNNIYVLAVLPEPNDPFNTTSSFYNGDSIFAPGQPFLSITIGSPLLRPGMKIRITGSEAGNNKDYIIQGAGYWFFGQLLTLDQPVTGELNVVLTIEILEGQYYILDRTPIIQQLTSPNDVTQDIKDSVYNVPLSPKRIFNLHKNWIAGGVYGYEPDSIKFTSNNRNKELISDGIIEKADVPIADLGEPDFIPKYFEFDTISPIDMTETLETDINPNMDFLWSDNSYFGFFLRGGIALNDLEEQTFKLLACRGNNLLNLI